MSLAALRRLAALWGVETEYVDDRHGRRPVGTESLVAVLQALGAPLARPADATDALRSERRRRYEQVMEPVTVAWAGRQATIRARLPESSGTEHPVFELRSEDGSPVSIPSEQVVRVGASTSDGERRADYEVQLSGPGVTQLPPGYYDVTLTYGGQVSSGLVVIAPPCPLPARGWGAFLPVQSFRSGTNLGVGTYPELGEVSRWITGVGGSFLGTLPLFPTFLDTPYEPSPYLPVTRLGWHELFIDPRAVPEWGLGSPERGGAPAPSVLTAEFEELRGSKQVDYRTASAVLRQLLEPMARSLFTTPSLRRQALVEFAHSRPELVAYARFRSEHEQGRVPSPRGDGAGTVDLDSLDDRGRFHLYAQWVAEEQVQASTGRLYLDLPVGVHPDGFDAWWETDSFATGVEGGAPPDPFFASGQAWGFRPLHPRRIRDDRYRYSIACLRQVMRHAAAVRIDHVMGLHRLFWIPQGGGPEHGVYVHYQLDETMAIVALEANRAGCAVVGEDLGTVPDVIRQTMAATQVLRSWVFQFEASPEDPLPDAPERSMATFGTHDLPRFAAFWEEDDGDGDGVSTQPESTDGAEWVRRQGWREALASLTMDPSPTGALRTCIDHMASSAALLTMVDLEDLWLERRQINRPGSGPGDGNWTERMSRTIESLPSDPAVGDLLDDIAVLRRVPLPTRAQVAGSSSPAPNPQTVPVSDRRGDR